MTLLLLLVKQCRQATTQAGSGFYVFSLKLNVHKALGQKSSTKVLRKAYLFIMHNQFTTCINDLKDINLLPHFDIAFSRITDAKFSMYKL